MNNELFAEKIELIKLKLYRIAFLYMQNEEDAMDAVSEAVYRGLLSVKKLREPEYFDTWMTRILINECNKMWRKTKNDVSIDDVPEIAENEKAFELLPLKEAIQKLPKELKEVIILRYYSDYTLSETAKALDIPQGTVVTRQRRALKLLKLELSEEQADES